MANSDRKEKKKKTNIYDGLDPKGLGVDVIGTLPDDNLKANFNNAQIVRNSENKLSLLLNEKDYYPLTIVPDKEYVFETKINEKQYQLMLKLKNPWENIIQKLKEELEPKPKNKSISEEGKEYIAGIDEGYIKAYQDEIKDGRNKKDDKKYKYTDNQKKEYIIHLEILPEPFWGDLENANVYILSGNPGFGGIEKIIDRKDAFKKAMKENLNRESSRLIWLDSNLKKDTKVEEKEKEEANQYVEVKEGEDIYHPGFDYWEDNTNELRNEIENKKLNQLNFGVIEYFPYHSMKISGEMKKCSKELPSRLFVDYYIEKAIKKGKWIVIARCKSEWLNRIQGLREYKNTSNNVLVTCSQQMSLSLRNLKKEVDMVKEEVNMGPESPAGAPIWEDFVKACTCKEE